MKPLVFAALLLAGQAFAQEDKLLAILKSDAPLKEKGDACRELAQAGTKQAVPVLAPLLADEQLSHMARFALEPIADPSVDVALRDALGKVKGRLLVGVISSLGVRKDTQAIEPLAKLLTETDPAVAQAAARALGSIGGAAVPALEGALSTSTPAVQFAVCEGLFRCAEARPPADATAIYDKLRTLPNLPYQVRVAALRGAIQSRGDKGVPLMVETIRTEAYVSAADAIRISMEMPGPEVTQALVGELAQANEEKQILLLKALGYRGDAVAATALVPLAQSGPAARRVAAIRSLVQLLNPSLLPLLATLAKDPEPPVSGAALAGLTAFPGKEADAALVALLESSDAKTRKAATEAVAQRRITAAVPALLNTTGDADSGVASASFKALGDLAGVADIPAVVDALSQTKAVPAAESALSAICARQPDPAICTDKLLPGLAKAQGEPKLALLRVLGTAGGPKALDAVRAAAADSDASVKETALRILCDWPKPDALPDLTGIAKTNADPKFKILALRGQLRLIPLQTVPDAQKVSQIKQILPLLERKDDHGLALATLADLPTAESLALVVPYLRRGELREEANIAAVAIAQKIVDRHPAEVAEAMKQVQTGNNWLADRARQLLARAQRH